MRPAFLALLLIGCGTLPDAARPLPESFGHAAVDVWAQAGYPVGSCADAAARVRVVVTDADEVRDLCHQERAAGCRVRRQVGLLGTGGYYTLIVMDREHATPWLLAHEAVHWLGGCSGVPTWHSDVRLFNAPGSVQARLAEL